jgi:hypothetical protein
MRISLAVTTIALALHGAVNAAPVRGCAQVSALVDAAVRPLLANPAEPQRDAAQLRSSFHSCLRSRNICSVVYNTDGKEGLAAGDITADLPAQYGSGQGSSSIIFLVRSIPRVRNDSNEYCLVSAKSDGVAAAQQWDVYGWVIAPNSSEPLPLERKLLDYEPVSHTGSLRGLAAALWLFAERMSGQQPSR